MRRSPAKTKQKTKPSSKATPKAKAKPKANAKAKPKARPRPKKQATRSREQRALESHQLVAAAREDRAARRRLVELVRAEPWREDLVDALGTFDDDEVYRFVREMAAAQLDLPYHDTQPRWFFALAELARLSRFTPDARELLVGGFERMAARSRNATSRTLVNSVGFAALAHAIAMLPVNDTGPALRDAFRIAAGFADIDAHYELNVTCGPLAIALAAVEHREALPELERFLGEFADTYAGAPFVLQVQYARWLLADDAAGALAYASDPEHKKSLSLAAAALADLHHVAAYEPLETRAASLEHPVAKEAFAEALARLHRQTAPPPVAGRMIWMFGRRSPTEQALGEDSDNVFVQRAIERTRNAELGVVTEADDSAPDD